MSLQVFKKPRVSTDLEPSRTIVLSESSSLEIYQDAVPCSSSDFSTLWNLHPTEHGEVVVYGKRHKVPRWMALYGLGTYTFAGQTMTPNPEIPELVQRCFDYANQVYPRISWNGALVNWYADGDHYIGKHSDDERDLQPNVPILSFSFGGVRTFRIAKKAGKTVVDVPTLHGSLIAMCGKMQKEFTHEVPRTKKPVGKRVNVTVRSFKISGGAKI